MYKKLTRQEISGIMSEYSESLTKSEILRAMSEGGGRVYFIGVGGVSMRSLFCLCRHFGIMASGSDRAGDEFINSLILSGEDIVIGERDSLPPDTRLIVYSHAIAREHPERLIGRREGIPEVSRDRLLGALMECYEGRIGVSGGHGKSTTTAMIAEIFIDAEKSPTVLSGAPLAKRRLPFVIGSLDWLIYEGCEYKDSFLSFSPTLSVFLNIELDHTDYFKNIEMLSESFLRAMKRAEKILVNADDPRLLSLAIRSGVRTVTFGKAQFADYRYERLKEKGEGLSFRLFYKDTELGVISLGMLGAFNISNAAAAIGAAMEEGIDFTRAAASLSEFHGIERRLEYIGDYTGRALYYDYAHHPTEIRESILALREKGAVTVVFRPHTYSRTADLLSGFVSSLSLADSVIMLDIDAVREENVFGISSERVAAEIGGIYCQSEDMLPTLLEKTEGSIVLMGAGERRGAKKLLTKGK